MCERRPSGRLRCMEPADDRDDDGNDGDDDDDLQTILRMHEREEKMKERLMDLRLKSEEQVGVLPYIWTLDNPLLRF